MQIEIPGAPNGVLMRATSEWLYVASQGRSEGASRNQEPANRPVGDVGLSWPEEVLATSAGAQLVLDAEQLLDRSLAEMDAGAMKLPWECFDTALEAGINLTKGCESSPYLLAIDRVSELGRRDFEYHYQYLLGGREVPVDRAGYFVRNRTSGRVHVLDARAFRLLDAMDRYNAIPQAERSSADAWDAFASIRRDAEESGVRMDEYLASNTVIVPSSIALHYVHHADGSLSFVPSCPELSQDDFATVFQRNPAAERVYSLDGRDGRRVRIVLDDRQHAVLQRMISVRRVDGETKRRAIEEPEAFFDGLLGDIEIKYGSRVTGIGDLVFTPVPSNAGGASLLEQVMAGGPGSTAGIPGDQVFGEKETTEPKQAQSRPEDGGAYATIALPLARGGGQAQLSFQSPSALRSFREQVASAVARGLSSLEHNGQIITVNNEVLDALTRPPGRQRTPEKTTGGKYLLIYTNEETLVESDVQKATAALSDADEATFTLPESLSGEVSLKPHQVEGIRWLSRCDALSPNRRGALLADDMGLGKTLQILAHLARLIEAGAIKDQANQGEGAPWRPILVVAPLILVENETWLAEMVAHFKNEGEVFRPWLTLYGATIAKVRADAAVKGRETVIGVPLLDARRLMNYRVIVTTYETVVNYQHSFAQLVDDRPLWSVIVADEAQRYKMLNTKVSVAMKAVPARFHIASTGTPVENRLLDLWNIVDTLQPALLGTATEFSRAFEKPLQHDAGQQRVTFDALRVRLRYGTPNAFLIRRTKDELTDLPSKSERRIRCQMSREEHDAHSACLDLLREDGPPGRHLAVLQRLALLSQHPFLTSEGLPDATADELIAVSAKLRAVIDVIEHIRAQGEKVILFARHVAVQNLLAYVIGHRMRIRVPIINGSMAGVPESTRSSDSTRRTRDGRKRVLDQFKSASGFGAIVLSPFVAGVGLTITEANHVIHYGRWWNPAVESQATDRAYRIGQTRPVTVYYPILEDPLAATPGASFDEVLDKLLTRKRALATDFLHPTSDEDTAAGELRNDLLGTNESSEQGASVLNRIAIDRLSAADFEALVAAVYDTEKVRAILTCQSGDGGADVLLVRQDCREVVQVKHVRHGGEVGIEAIADVVGARDTYCGRLGGVWRATIVTSGRASASCVQQAGNLGVKIIDGDALSKKVAARSITLKDVVRAAEQRSISFEEGLRRAS